MNQAIRWITKMIGDWRNKKWERLSEEGKRKSTEIMLNMIEWTADRGSMDEIFPWIIDEQLIFLVF
jgi:phage host-nuclease inhibitor protein Gam